MNLPNFFIIGAAKAGSTSLYEYLIQHPQVYMSPIKEPHYYSNIRPSAEHAHIVCAVSDTKKYLSLFKGAGGYKAIGEASTSYLSEIGTAQRIKAKIPDAKIIILLRDPVDRAYSHYLMDVRDGFQDLSFWDAIQSDYMQCEKGWGISHMYVELGLYFEQVRQYIDCFARDRVLILFFDDFITNELDILLRVADFLEIDPEPMRGIDFTKIYNQFALPRGAVSRWFLRSPRIKWLAKFVGSDAVKRYVRKKILLQQGIKPPLDEKSRVFLNAIYEQDLVKLEALIAFVNK